ncbi:SDR family oxidoreductase [Pseudomonas sp. MRSN 12121]|uniref:SDR family oxidoreductase n=1 Tax=Pseudomonas sp. MRSN 12121 TaxID=1611770 RepID=UPI0005BEA839|nr:SDR family oxidoreductase [Pseudomonas sp. MRSN 12121]AJO78623.1 short-chain dehydrogenase [Pseudomonas sp. MRSN 12121]
MKAHIQPVALVTGANKGIGLAITQQLAARGYTVYLASRDEKRGAEAKASIERPGLDIRPICLDVTDVESIAAAAARLKDEVGSLDVLVNNAGIAGQPLPPSQCDAQALRDVYEANVIGPVSVTRLLLPLLRAGQKRTIVNVSSELGSLTLHSYPDFPFAPVNLLAYCSSKTALNAFTVLLAKELREDDFKVNSVNPGFTATDLNGFTGKRTVDQAAEIVVKYATLDVSGPTGGFFTDGGFMPW